MSEMKADLSDTLDANTFQYLTFSLGGELYAFSVLKVREVLEYTKITRVPRTPPFVAGVINLRGSVVPVIDLRVRFNFAQNEITEDTSIIIVEVNYEGELITIGALVDAVKEVVAFASDEIESSPKIGMSFDDELLYGMGKTDGAFVLIFNAEKLFSAKELGIVDKSKMFENIIKENGKADVE